jgi:hypothetical protein
MSEHSTDTARAEQAEVEYRDLEPLGFPGYRVGSDGSVWSRWKSALRVGWALSDQWHRLKPFFHRGRHKVHLRPDKRNKNRFVQALVLTAFVGPCPEGLECRHLNDVKTDNRLANLCWGTRADNVKDAIRNQTHRRGVNHPFAKLTDADVVEIRKLRLAGLSLRAIARVKGVSNCAIGQVLDGKSWKHVPTEERGKP